MNATPAELVGRGVGRIGFGAMRLPGRGVFGPPLDRGVAHLEESFLAGALELDAEALAALAAVGEPGSGGA